MDLESEEEMLTRRLGKIHLEKQRRQEARRSTFDLTRTCKTKKYWKDDNAGGTSGTVL